jgi:3-hydroxyisobutyrate dehydrogenase
MCARLPIHGAVRVATWSWASTVTDAGGVSVDASTGPRQHLDQRSTTPQRPHRRLKLQTPEPREPDVAAEPTDMRRRDRLDGLVHEYGRIAACTRFWKPSKEKEARIATTDGGTTGHVAVLGTGIMGSAMARNLVAAGLQTTVWDRSTAATEALSAAGATVASSAQEAVRDADVVVSMLPTAEVVNSVVFDGGVAQAFLEGAIWAQMGTIGISATAEIVRRLAELRPDVMFVDAPVSGSKGPAETGQLLILASGPPDAVAILRPALSAIGRKTIWLGDAGQGSRMKLVVNAYMSILIEGVAEALELADRLGIDSAKLAEAIDGGPLDAPIADAKLHKMEQGDFAPEFPLEWALKDVDLAIASGGDALPLLTALSQQWHAAVDAGHGREDVSAARLMLTNPE